MPAPNTSLNSHSFCFNPCVQALFCFWSQLQVSPTQQYLQHLQTLLLLCWLLASFLLAMPQTITVRAAPELPRDGVAAPVPARKSGSLPSGGIHRPSSAEGLIR